MLTLVEELLLLTLDEERHEFTDLPARFLGPALAGGLLCDLSLRRRLDSDLTSLIVLDRTPTGEKLLDNVLAQVAANPGNAKDWIVKLSDEGDRLRAAVIDSLVAKGAISKESKRVVFVLPVTKYAAIDAGARNNAKLKLMNLVLTPAIPDPADLALFCVADAALLLDGLFSATELKGAEKRMETLRKLDLIGRQIVAAVGDVVSLANRAR